MTASLEASSEHPIAAGIVNDAKEKGLELVHVHEFKAIPGKGVEGQVLGKRWGVASPGYLRESKIELKDERVEKLEQQGKTVVFLLEEDRPIGAIALADIIRKKSRERPSRSFKAIDAVEKSA